MPEQWSVSAQRITLDELQQQAKQSSLQLQRLSQRLPHSEHELQQKLSAMIGSWAVLGQHADPFQGWQQILYEIDSIQQFIDELKMLSDLPELINHFLTESGRYQHI